VWRPRAGEVRPLNAGAGSGVQVRENSPSETPVSPGPRLRARQRGTGLWPYGWRFFKPFIRAALHLDDEEPDAVHDAIRHQLRQLVADAPGSVGQVKLVVCTAQKSEASEVLVAY
jgi:hypothetical protein